MSDSQFTALNLEFLKSALPQNFTKDFLVKVNNTIDNNAFGTIFKDLFKKHNLDNLLATNTDLLDMLNLDPPLSQ